MRGVHSRAQLSLWLRGRCDIRYRQPTAVAVGVLFSKRIERYNCDYEMSSRGLSISMAYMTMTKTSIYEVLGSHELSDVARIRKPTLHISKATQNISKNVYQLTFAK